MSAGSAEFSTGTANFNNALVGDTFSKKKKKSDRDILGF